MATVILGTVGSILGGPVGGAIGSAIGSYVDNSFLLPWLFPSDPIRGPRLNEISLSSSDEGAPGNFTMGPFSRVSAARIWLSDLKEVTVRSGGGGKGGGRKSKTIGYEYYVDIAIAYHFGEIDGVEKIYCEGKLLYDDNPNVQYTSSTFAVSKPRTGIMRVTTTNAAIKLERVRQGSNVTITGFANGANNGTFRCIASYRDRSTGNSWFEVKNTAAVIEAAGASVTITQILPQWDPAKAESITFYDGTTGQIPDALIESYEGVGNVPAWTGVAYAVIKNLHLLDYGNRVPEFNVIVRNTVGATAADAIAEVFRRAGRTPDSDIIASEVSGSVRGMPVTGIQVAGQILQPLMLAYDTLVQDTTGKLRYFDRSKATVIDVDEGDLAFHDEGADVPRPIKVSDIPEAALPQVFDVKHLDDEAEAQEGDQRQPTALASVPGYRSITIPIVMTGAKARAIARRLQWSTRANRQRVLLSLPPSYWRIQENDLLRFYALGQLWTVLVQRKDTGANFQLDLEAVLEVKSTLTQVEIADERVTQGDPPNIDPPPDLQGGGQEPPAHGHGSSTGQGDPRFFLMTYACNPDPDRTWTGCAVFRSDDDDIFEQVGFIGTESIMGNTLTSLAAGVVGVWDYVNTVDVWVLSGELETKTEIEVLNGGNRALIGSEIIGFKSASLIGEKTYRLSGLLRGLRGTGDKMSTHAVDDVFVLLIGDGVADIEHGIAHIGTTKYYRFVPPGGVVDDYPSVQLTLSGETLRPLPVAGISGSRDDDGNLTITWHRSSRAVGRMFSTAVLPLLEDSEVYEVDIHYPSGGAGDESDLIRTITVSAESATYTDAQQATDSVTLFDEVTVKIYQRSAIVGRGKVATANL